MKLQTQEWAYLKDQMPYIFDHFYQRTEAAMGGGSTIHTQYNIRTTPKVYILGKDKTIIAKDLGVEHLDEAMRRLLQQ